MASRLTFRHVAWQNLGRRPFRSAMAGIVVAIAAGVLFGGTLLIVSLRGGIDSAQARLGADILVVPKGYEAPVQAALLRGEPSTLYMDRQVLDRIAEAPGVAATSPQLFVATLNAGCCSVPVQIIGYDPASDFTIGPWVQGRLLRRLGENEIVTGSRLVADVGDELKFYGQPYRVAATLDQTGTGIDRSVFMSLETAYRMAAESESHAEQKLEITPEDISVVLVSVKPGYDPLDVASEIQWRARDVATLQASDVVKQVTRQLQSLSAVLWAVVALLWLVTIGVLLATFMMVVDERKRELGLLRAMGATRRHVMRLIILEATVLTVVGTLGGLAAGGVLLYAFKGLIAISAGMPQLFPGLAELAGITAACALAGIAAGPLAGLYPAWRAGRLEPYAAIREGE